jgi:hypothetical protein
MLKTGRRTNKMAVSTSPAFWSVDTAFEFHYVGTVWGVAKRNNLPS